MKLDIFQIDTFSDHLFGGNPACVVPLKEWLSDSLLMKIAKENAVAETAFFLPKEDRFHLRWFTPEIEMDLCGHATLATAHAIKTILNHPRDQIIFETLSGELIVNANEGLYTLDFPSRKPLPAQLPKNLIDSLNLKPREVFKSRDYVLVYDTQKEVEEISVDQQSKG